jgi:hypothetical protein
MYMRTDAHTHIYTHTHTHAGVGVAVDLNACGEGIGEAEKMGASLCPVAALEAVAGLCRCATKVKTLCTSVREPPTSA